MTDYFDSCLFTDTVSFAKVEQVVKMVIVSMRIHFEPENTDESLQFFYFLWRSGPVQAFHASF